MLLLADTWPFDNVILEKNYSDFFVVINYRIIAGLMLKTVNILFVIPNSWTMF